ncbi:MAG: hypothetical protein LBG07_08390 [Treponema sp.]|jgi:hypothetical protein|nr:hypothetical protein [Treponema sp.]
MRFPVLPLLLWFVCLGALGALDFHEIHGDLTFKPEYHRSFGFCREFAAAGESLIGDSVGLQGGLALGRTGEEFDLDIFLGASYLLPLPVNLRVRFLYIYNTIPAYTYQTNTLFPLLSFQGKWGGAEMGFAFRFTVFDSDPSSIFEPILGGRFFLNFPFIEKVKLSLGFGNFSAFNMGNLGAYFLFLESRVDINRLRSLEKLREKWRGVPLVSLISNLEFYQTGSIGFSAAFQGFAWQGGVRLSW